MMKRKHKETPRSGDPAEKPSRLHRKLGPDSKPDVFELQARSGVRFLRLEGNQNIEREREKKISYSLEPNFYF